MDTRRRIPLVMAALATVILTLAGPAAAAAPDNDDLESATTVTDLPFTDMIDTSEATEAADDPDCFGAGPTVWYALTLDSDTFLEVNTNGSDYDTTLSAYLGERGNLEQIACDDDSGESVRSRIRFDAAAGQTYYLMVGAFGSGSGGNLVLTALEADPADVLTVDVALDPVGRVAPRSGTAWLSGTVSCSGADSVEVFAGLRQRAGRAIITGSGSDFLPCDGETEFTLEIRGENGVFAGGRADATADVFACGEDECSSAFVEQEVRLRGGGGR